MLEGSPRRIRCGSFLVIYEFKRFNHHDYEKKRGKRACASFVGGGLRLSAVLLLKQGKGRPRFNEKLSRKVSWVVRTGCLYRRAFHDEHELSASVTTIELNGDRVGVSV